MRIQIAGVHKYQILTSVAIKINSKWPTNCAGTFPPMLDGEDPVPFAIRPHPAQFHSQSQSQWQSQYQSPGWRSRFLFICISCYATEVHISVRTGQGGSSSRRGGPGGGSLTQAPMCAHSERQSYLFYGFHVPRSTALAPNVGNI